jgi:Histidine kinase-like ATPase domain
MAATGTKSDRTSGLELAPRITAPGIARGHVRAVLGSWQLPPGTVQTAETLTSEIVTNAYHAAVRSAERRGLPGPDERQGIGLTLRLLPAGQVVIEVADHDPGSPLMPEQDLEAESGRGLLLVEALSKEWGVRPLSSGGKVVYAVIEAALEPGGEVPWPARLLVARPVLARLIVGSLARLRRLRSGVRW